MCRRCYAITTKLIVEGPRDSNLEHTRIQRIPRYLECLTVSKEVIVQVLILEQDTHSLPLGRDEGINIWIGTYLDLVLVIEHGECRVVARCVVACIEATIEANLRTQNVALNPELIVVRKEGRYEWHRDYGAVRG